MSGTIGSLRVFGVEQTVLVGVPLDYALFKPILVLSSVVGLLPHLPPSFFFPSPSLVCSASPAQLT